MQALGRDDQHLRHPALLFLSFAGFRIAVAYPNFPAHTQSRYHLFHCPPDVLGQRPQRRYPQQLQSGTAHFLEILRMPVDEFEQPTEKNGKSLAATRRRIYQPRPALQDMLPGHLLERKRLSALRFHPAADGAVTYRVL